MEKQMPFSAKTLIKEELSNFEKSLKQIINSTDNFLKQDLEDFIFSKPKRLRVIFVFLFSKILDIKDFDIVNKIALTAELTHSASLIHDDIIDCSKTRRNLLTFDAKFNSKIAVLEGDFLLSLALNELSKTSLDIVKIYSEIISKTIQGELKQNEDINKIADEKTYIERSFEKTGNLFLFGLLALLSLDKKVDNKLKNALINFTKNYSTAFQIENDIKNVKQDNSDFTNGNYTLPVIYFFMENNKIPNKNNLEKYIAKANKVKEEFKLKALKDLSEIKDSDYKKALIEITKTTLGADF